MEQKALPPPSEPHISSGARRMLGLATLAATSVACKLSDVVVSPDPVASFARGAVGMVLIEAELGAGKLVSFALTKTQSCGLALLSMGVVAIPPAVVGALSIEYPAVGYAALAIPIVSALAYVLKRD